MVNNQWIKEKSVFVIALLSLFSYLVPFTSAPIMVDKNIIIEPLEKIHSVADYIEAFKVGAIYDFQPVRDLSHKVDLVLVDAIGWRQIPLVHNLIILLITTLLVYRIMRVYFGKDVGTFLALLYFVHPATLNVYVEFTARKHILSFMFFLFSYHYFLKNYLASKRDRFFSYMTYFLSILSHPINSLGFVLFVAILRIERKDRLWEIFKKSIPYAIVFIPGVLLSIDQLGAVHRQNTGTSNVIYLFIPENILTGISYHYRNYFVPFFYPRFYARESFFPIVFSILAPIGYLYAYRRNKKITQISLLLAFLVFVTLYGHRSNVLATQFHTTYGLTSFFSFLLLTGIFINYKKWFNALLILLIPISIFYGSIRTDNVRYMDITERIESECKGTQGLILHGLKFNNMEMVREHSKFWQNNSCNVIGKGVSSKYVVINSMLIHMSDDFSRIEKEKMFKRKFVNFEDQNILLASLELQENNKTNLFYSLLEPYKDGVINSYFLSQTYAGRMIMDTCKDDERKECREFMAYVDRVSKLSVLLKWNKSIKID
ncbi:MAG: hypothetical protein HON90_15765 [Halobacteriovoraceae bacterium]|nr:hypothetical protein [Halobacteriovoraceae bacterium]